MPRGQRALLDSALIDRSSCLVDPSNSLISNSSARDLQHWTWRPPAASLEPGINMFWISAVTSLGIIWIICTCLGICASFTMFGCAAVFWQCISGHCTSAGTSTFMCCCYETSVLCCTFWPELLMYCTCGNFNGLCILWISFLCTLNLGSLDLLGRMIHFSG